MGGKKMERLIGTPISLPQLDARSFGAAVRHTPDPIILFCFVPHCIKYTFASFGQKDKNTPQERE
jgi:hypothetical protein